LFSGVNPKIVLKAGITSWRYQLVGESKKGGGFIFAERGEW